MTSISRSPKYASSSTTTTFLPADAAFLTAATMRGTSASVAEYPVGLFGKLRTSSFFPALPSARAAESAVVSNDPRRNVLNLRTRQPIASLNMSS